MTLLSNYTNEEERVNADNLMKILMIEKMLKNIVDEIDNLKNNLIKNHSIM